MIGRRKFLLAAPALLLQSSIIHANNRFRFTIDQTKTDLIIRNQGIIGNETYNLAGRTQLSSALVNGQSTAILIFVGQSLVDAGINTRAQFLSNPAILDPAAVYVPTNGNLVQNLSIGNKGAIFNCVDPLLGGLDNLSHIGSRLADKLINGGTYARVILVTIALAGTYFADWAFGGGVTGAGGTRTGLVNYRIGLAARCLANIGLLNNPGLAKTIILVEDGQQDSNAPNTTQANATTALQNIIDSFRFVGFSAATVPILIASSTNPANAGAVTIRAAQAAVVNNSVGVYVGSNTDSIPVDTTNRYDLLHMAATAIGSNIGSDQHANLWQTAILAAPH